MARGLRRGPVLLRFRSLVDSVAHYVAGIVDTRQFSKIRYTLRDCYLSAVALFFVQDSSLLQFQRRFQRKFQANNLSSTFGVREIPVDSQLRHLIDRHDQQPILPCFADWIGRLQRCKWLQHFQIFDARYLITLDGSRYFSSEAVHCAHCLTTTKNGTTRYHHDILQAAIVHPDQRQVLPLAPEFVRNSDADGGNYRKQDCEITAGYRMLARLRADYPRMAAIIVADSLYSKQPFVEQVTAKRFSFLLVAKPGDHKSLYQDLAVLRRANLLDRHTTEHRQERREYEWITDLPLNGNPNSPHINFIRLRIVKAGKTYENAWVTDLTPTSANIVQLVRAARARWKIENEGFNTLKNQGYHLEHNFGHGDQHLSEAFFTLNLIAFFIHQIFELVDGLYQRVRTLLQFPPRVLGRGALRLPAVSVYLLGPSVGAHELAAAAVAPLAGSLVPHPVPTRAAAPPSRVPTTTMPHHLRQGSPCALPPAAARSTEPHPESARLRRLARSVPVPRLTWPCRRSQTFSSGHQLPFTENRCFRTGAVAGPGGAAYTRGQSLWQSQRASTTLP